MFSIEDFVQEVNKNGLLISAPQSLLVVFSHSKGDGTPHVEKVDGEYFYVSSERGYEIFREKISSKEELLFLFFKNVTAKMASDYELKNRIQGQDSRRQMFFHKLELLGKINREWERSEREDIKKILEENPYDDFASDRAKYCRELRGKGVSENEIEVLAFKKYPL